MHDEREFLMIAVIQRVSEASVLAGGETVGSIGRGLAALVAVERDDSPAIVDRFAERLVTYRLFPHDGKAFDLDVQQAGGAVLLVSNFTVAADTQRGRRPSLDPAASPEAAEPLFQRLIEGVRSRGVTVETGRFRTEMQVRIVNDGPITVVLRS